MSAPSPIQPGNFVATFSIKINDAAIDDTYRLYSLHVVHELNKESVAEVQILCGEPDKASFAPADDAAFAPGNTISISAGHDGAVQTEIFSGTIEKLVLNITGDGSSYFTLMCTKPAEAAQAKTDAPVLTITYGENLMAFNAELGRHSVTGSAKFQGSALAKPGENLELAADSKRFGGIWAIMRSAHEFVQGNWITTVDLNKDR